jgi:hypothetical protein
MRWRRARQATVVILAGAGLFSGCYYDPSTGLTYAYPPVYGYPQAPPPAYGEAAPGYGEAAPAPGYGEAAPQAYAAAPPAYAAPPPAYGGPSPAYGGAPAGWITRDQYIQRAMQRATAANRDPQRAAQRAGAVFDQIDVNHTGVVTQAQIQAWRQAHARPPGAGQPQPQYQ